MFSLVSRKFLAMHNIALYSVSDEKICDGLTDSPLSLLCSFLHGWAEIECTIHVAPPQPPKNQFRPVQQSRQQMLSAYCPEKNTVGSQLRRRIGKLAYICMQNRRKQQTRLQPFLSILAWFDVPQLHTFSIQKLRFRGRSQTMLNKFCPLSYPRLKW